jgi:hypothetical protein
VLLLGGAVLMLWILWQWAMAVDWTLAAALFAAVAVAVGSAGRYGWRA